MLDSVHNAIKIWPPNLIKNRLFCGASSEILEGRTIIMFQNHAEQ